MTNEPRDGAIQRLSNVSEITVTVVYALPDAATEIAVRLPAGATIAEAIDRASLAAGMEGADPSRCPVGIFGKRAQRDTVLCDGDRVELYRPLIVDPKQARRRRASNKRR
jgi:putative ubiquitin-RnfH superfamily antitoxin RatB of RatAB toxin-antitoxin module